MTSATAPARVALNIDAYGTYARQSALADYLEVAALIGTQITEAALARSIEENGWATLPRRQFLTIANVDEDPEAWAQSVFSLIRERVQILDQRYPFEFQRTSIRLRVPPMEILNSPYLALLAITVLHAWRLENPDGPRPEDILEGIAARALENRGLIVSRMGVHDRQRRSFVEAVVEGGRLLGLKPMTNPLPRKAKVKDAGVDTLAGVTWRDGRSGGQWIFIGQATVGESGTWAGKLTEPEPGLWAKYMQEPLEPLPFLAVPHHIDADHLAHMATARKGLILDRLRLCLSIDDTTPEEKDLIAQLLQVIVE
jgi:hypothetical protein